MHHRAVFPIDRGGHGVKLLNKRKNRRNKNIERDNTLLGTKKPEDRAKIYGLSGSSENIINLDIPTEYDTQVFMRVNEVDRGPGGPLNTSFKRFKILDRTTFRT